MMWLVRATPTIAAVCVGLGAAAIFAYPAYYKQHRQSVGPTLRQKALWNQGMQTWLSAEDAWHHGRNFAVADARFQQAMKLLPRMGEIRRDYADCLAAQGRTREAMIAYRHLLDPNAPPGSGPLLACDAATIAAYTRIARSLGARSDLVWVDHQAEFCRAATGR